MKTLLTIDTSADVCSIGLQHEGKLIEKKQRGFKSHATIILSFIDELLVCANISLSDIELIIFVKGPGSFTGLRIAACVAQGLAVSQNIRIVGISSLQAIAQGAYRRYNANNIWVVNDARMNEVYHARYECRGGSMLPCSIEHVESIDKLVWRDDVRYIGSAFLPNAFPIPETVLKQTLSTDAVTCEPQDLIALAQLNTSMSAEFALPSYVRNQVAYKKRDTHG